MAEEEGLQEALGEHGIRIEDRLEIKLSVSESMSCAIFVHIAIEALENRVSFFMT